MQGGARPFTLAAVLLAVFGLLVLLVELQDPDASLYWTGRQVQGVNDGGIVYYHVDGKQYTVNVDGSNGPSTPEPTTVFVDRSDPFTALPDRFTRWIDYGFVAVWFVGAAALLLLGQHRRRRRLRTRATVPPPRAADAVDGRPRSSRS